MVPTSQTLSCPQKMPWVRKVATPHEEVSGTDIRGVATSTGLKGQQTSQSNIQQEGRAGSCVNRRVRVLCFVPFCFGFCPAAVKSHSQAGGQRNFSLQINMEPPAAWLRERGPRKGGWDIHASGKSAACTEPTRTALLLTCFGAAAAFSHTSCSPLGLRNYSRNM